MVPPPHTCSWWAAARLCGSFSGHCLLVLGPAQLAAAGLSLSQSVVMVFTRLDGASGFCGVLFGIYCVSGA